MDAISFSKGSKNTTDLANIARFGLKKTGTLTQAAASITISADSGGNPLNLKRSMLIIHIPAISGVAHMRLRFNGISDAKYYDTIINPNGASANGTGGYGNTLYGESVISSHLIGGNIHTISHYTHSTNAPAITQNDDTFVLKDGTITGITSFNMFLSTGDNFPIGTTYELYGEAVS